MNVFNVELSKEYYVGYACFYTYISYFLDFAATFSNDTTSQTLMDQQTQIDFIVILKMNFVNEHEVRKEWRKKI